MRSPFLVAVQHRSAYRRAAHGQPYVIEEETRGAFADVDLGGSVAHTVDQVGKAQAFAGNTNDKCLAAVVLSRLLDDEPALFRRKAVRREVFKQTRSYNEGKEQELIKYRLEYIRAKTDVEKKAIASTIRHAFADYDENLLDSDELRRFIVEIKYGE